MDDLNTRLSRLEGKYETDMGWLKDKAETMDNKIDTLLTKVGNQQSAIDENKGRDRLLSFGGSALIAGAVSWVVKHF
jgi:hypothetical protein